MTASTISELAGALGIPLDPQAAERLARFTEELSRRGAELGLIAPSDSGRVLERHVVDSLRAVRAVELGDRRALDLGSGGGLPGLPLAIALPHLEVGLVEARRRKAAWLEFMVDRLSLDNVSVLLERIETLSDRVDVCFARALGSLGRSWALAEPLLRPGGRLCYFAGRGFRAPTRPPKGSRLSEMGEPPIEGLESSGPLVIIRRQ